MPSPASLLARLWVLGALAVTPALAAPAAKAPAPASAQAKSAGPKAPAAKAPAKGTIPREPVGAPVFAGGSCSLPDDKDAQRADKQHCAPATVADLAISSMDLDPEWDPKPLPFTWDVPRVVQMIPMSEVMEANGYPVKIAAVLSTERPEVILQHMVDRFEEAGLYIPPVEHQPQMLREPQLTALDPMGLISYTFILQPNPNKTTTVILGETNVGKRRPPSSDVAPIMPGASAVMHSRQEAARMLAYAAPVPVKEAKTFYDKQLGALGYQEKEPGLWGKEGDEMSLSLQQAEGGQTAVVIIRRGVASSAP